MAPSLAELTNRFLRQPRPEGIESEVELYDAATAFRTEPRAAWQETLTVLKALGVTGPMPMMPPDWAATVRSQNPAKFLPMALGHYPQQVSELSTLLDRNNHAPHSTATAKTISVLKKITDNNESALINENAVEKWNDGDMASAVALWNTLPDGAVRSFNLGMAALAMGNLPLAKCELTKSIAVLPQDSGWKALAELYYALAETKLTP